jgi:hypothetical protein
LMRREKAMSWCGSLNQFSSRVIVVGLRAVGGGWRV